MNLHEGKFTAIVRRTSCQFNGNAWSTPDPELTALLNDATASTPKTHVGIRELAEIVLRKVNLWDTAQILSFKQIDEFDDLPSNSIP